MEDDTIVSSRPECTAVIDGSCPSSSRLSNFTCQSDDTAVRPACDRCAGFDPGAVYGRCIELSDLRSAADSGCLSCHIFCLAMDHFDGPSGSDSSIWMYSSAIICGHEKTIDFFVEPDEHDEWADFIPPPMLLSALACCIRFSSFWGCLRVCSPIDSDPSSEGTFAKIRRWLARCDANHPKCAPDNARLPTRVVDVGTPDGQCLAGCRRDTRNMQTTYHCPTAGVLLS